MDRLHWTTRECVNVARHLRAVGASGAVSPDQLYGRTKQFVDDMLRRANEARYTPEEIQWMSYAIVALLDEIVMSQPGPLRDYWTNRPLQMAYFRENTAGENFFVHLDTVRRGPKRPDVLRLFYTCLLLGFQGRYRVRGGAAELTNLTDSVGNELASLYPSPEVLSPYGIPQEQPLARVTRRLPLAWMAAGAAVLVGLLYLGLHVSLNEQVQRLLDSAQRTNAVQHANAADDTARP